MRMLKALLSTTSPVGEPACTRQLTTSWSPWSVSLNTTNVRVARPGATVAGVVGHWPAASDILLAFQKAVSTAATGLNPCWISLMVGLDQGSGRLSSPYSGCATG